MQHIQQMVSIVFVNYKKSYENISAQFFFYSLNKKISVKILVSTFLLVDISVSWMLPYSACSYTEPTGRAVFIARWAPGQGLLKCG